MRIFGKMIALLAAAIVALCVSASAFSDTQGHFAERAIEKWSGSYGVINGYEDGTFRPDDPITRGAFAGILDRFLRFQRASPRDTFTDTAGTYWEEQILKLHAAGVYLGNGGRALAAQSITRQQAVTMIARAFAVEAGTTTLPYLDAAQISDYAAAYVAEFTAQGYLTDSEDGRFRPTDPITRAEIVQILFNMIEEVLSDSAPWTRDVMGTLLIRSENGAEIKDATVAGDVLIAPGVTGKVIFTDAVVRGAVRNFGAAEVEYRTAAQQGTQGTQGTQTAQDPQDAPQTEGISPQEVYTPGTPTGQTLTYSGKTVPIYAERERNTFSDDEFYWDLSGRIVYTGVEFETQYGVDISSYQGEVDWEAVAADGIDFAMIRVGYRGYGAAGTLNRDKRYQENIRGAMAAGLETGVYFFAQAITVEEAIEEAEFVLDLLRGQEINGPVAYDWEMHDATYRVYGTAPEMATACAVAFCERIAEAGYTPMVYAGSYVSYIKYDQGPIAKYLSWYPEYKTENSVRLAPTLVYHMDYWQFTSSGIVIGVDGRTDMNIRFIRK